MKSIFYRFWPIFVILFTVFIFFSPFFLQGKIPIPADTIVGMYHPFRDVAWDNLTAGVPFKNFLITDAVRQQYPWRKYAIDRLKNGQLPLWNPSNFSGTPLLANLQSAIFNPLNILLLILPFNFGWGLQVVLQIVLATLFMYLWLRNLKLSEIACIFGAITWSFGGFFTAWLEWNTILHSAMWLPLMLLAVDKLFSVKKTEALFYHKQIFKWSMVFILSLTFSFFAGHLQTFFYVTVFSSIYLALKIIRIKSKGENIKRFLLLFTIAGGITLLLVSVQLVPSIELIINSGRSFDQPLGFRTDWYLPYKHLVQLLIPDFFGNPSTLNYWGNWNYGEFVSYIGIIPLFMVLVSIIGRRDKKTVFFTVLAMAAFVFALPNFLSFLPYKLNLPFISTTAPSRLILIADFSLSVLAALGLDWIIKKGQLKVILLSGFILFLAFSGIWFSLSVNLWQTETINLIVAKRNIYLPALLMAVGFMASIIFVLFNKINKKIGIILICLLLLFTIFDLLRFSGKFNPFVKEEWIFPQTKVMKFLADQPKPFRVQSLDSRILPPNFSLVYGIETIEGYDPLYLLTYGQFMAAVKRNNPDISSFNFNRIITPQLMDSSFINLLNVRYFLSLTDIIAKNLKLVFREGETRIYENVMVNDRFFTVDSVLIVDNNQEEINGLFDIKENLTDKAIIRYVKGNDLIVLKGMISNVEYSSDKIKLTVSGAEQKFLVISSSYYPGWKATANGNPVKIYKTDYALMGIPVPPGVQQVEVYYQPTSFYIGLTTTMLGLVFIILWGIKVWIKKSA